MSWGPWREEPHHLREGCPPDPAGPLELQL